MLSALVLFTLIAYVDAAGNVIIQCPSDCNCDLSHNELNVNCGRRFPHVDSEKLYGQLDLMLSTDHLVVNLTSLSITNTPLTHVPVSVCKRLSLTSLNLDDNRLTELPDNCFTRLKKLVTLSATWNSITGLQDGLFDGMQSLETLDLSSNLIAFIGLGVFSNSSDLSRLRRVELSYNRLTSLEPWPYYRFIVGSERSPVTISLHNNMISNFTNKLNFEYRCEMKKPYGYLNLNHNRISHVMDIINGWNLDRGQLYTAMLCMANVLYHLQLRVSIVENPYICDCIDFPIYKLVRYTPGYTILDEVRCTNVDFFGPGWQAMLSITVPLNQFVCKQPDRCPPRCQCVYRPANITLHVYCSGANLSSLPLDLPPLPKSYVKYKLDFSNNKLLQRLEHRPYFANTSILDVSNCSLIEITMDVWTDIARVGMTNFRENMLQTFPRQADTVNISARLLVGGNPWRCSCDNSWMIGWLQSLSDHISDPGDITCASPSTMSGRLVMKSTVEDFCVDPVKRVLTIIISAVSSVVFVVFLLIITGILVYKLRVKYFRRWKFHPFDRDECVGEDMDYDVFLCCSSQDHNPHGLRILREMESNGYRVCYHERDFLPGSLITDNMTQSVERSKRTVCLVSSNFLRRL